MKKRIAVLLLAFALVITSSTTAMAAGNPLFTDLPEAHWSYQYVSELCAQGVVNGYPDGTFRPTKNVTYGEAFKLILLAIGVKQPAAVAGQHWAMPYVQLALNNNLLYSFNTNYLDSVPSRLTVARMTARALDLIDVAGESPYNDCEDGYVVELYEKGIMDGFLNEDGTRSFLPNKPISREEMAAIIWRVMNTNVSEGMLRVSNYWVDVLAGVPRSTFSASQFSKDAKGRVIYNGGYYAQGIDVSGYQGNINWSAVAADGIDFAIIRAGNRGWGTAGTLMVDSKFDQNMSGAIAAGLDVGAYYFSNAITAAEGAEEAEVFLAMLEPYRDHITYPIVCDWEYLGGSQSRAYGVDARIITQGIVAFCEKVAAAGYTPMVYFNEYCGMIKMDLSKLTQYQFWYAQYSSAPSCIYNFQFWQYSSSGKVAGISSNVDMNLCFVPMGKNARAGESASVEPASVEPGPVEAEPAEPEPVEPAQTDPMEPEPAQTEPVETDIPVPDDVAENG